MMAEASNPARDATWDIARGIGMMLLIYGHLLEPIYPANPTLGCPLMLFADRCDCLALAWAVQIIGAIFAMSFGYAPEATRSVSDAVFYIDDPILEVYRWSLGVLLFLTSLYFVQLLAYFLLRRIPALAVVFGAMAATGLVVYFNAPNYFLFGTWMPGLSFFALGYLFSQWNAQWPVWLCIPLFAAVIVLAPLNSGCSFSFQRTLHALRRRPIWRQDFRGKLWFAAAFLLVFAAWVGCRRESERRAGSLPRLGDLRLHGKKQPAPLHHQRLRGHVPAVLHPADTLA
jgi:fucose 4-O-acetylase-like acetyltransferase